MGTTYRAWDSQRGIPVVIKKPQPRVLRHPVLRERFDREVRIMAAFDHPDIVPVIDHGEESQTGPYIVLRFLPGGSLRDRHTTSPDGSRKPKSPATLRLWLPSVAAALDHIHSRHVAHRDVKPANIFFDAHSKAYLGDFGIAKVMADSDGLSVESSLTNDIPPGTLPYMPPEAFVGAKERDAAKGDQYALAMCVFEWLAGTLPFDLGSPVLPQVISGDIPPLSRQRRSLPLGISLAVAHALQRDPTQRFESCCRFVDAVLRDVGPLARISGEYILLCPGCGKLIRIYHGLSGRTCRCSECGARLRVSRDVDALWLAEEESPAAPRGGASTPAIKNRAARDVASTQWDTDVPGKASWLQQAPQLRAKYVGVGIAAVVCVLVAAIVLAFFVWR